MERKTKQQIVTHMVSHEPDELSEMITARMFDARVRALVRGDDFHFKISSYFFDFFFDAACPSGAIINKADGSGLDNYNLFVPLHGSIDLKAGSNWVRAAVGAAAFGESPTFSEEAISRGSRFLVVGIDRAEMARQLSELIERPVAKPFDFASTVDLTKDRGLMIKAAALALQTGLEGSAPLLQSPIAMKRMKEAMIALMLEGIPHRYSEELRGPVAAASPYYVKRAIEFMWAHASRPLSAAEIAAECGVSVRALNSGFRGFKAVSMMAYLREIRLSAVRQELRNPGTTASIAAIAQKWGFTHFGRFSSEYEKRFGELPSHTRRRSVGAGPGLV